MIDVGARLKAARKERGWTLRDAERHTGIPNAHISQIETGAISRPELATIAPIAAAYGLSLDELADGEVVTEHAIQMSGGGFHVRNSAPYIEEIYPLGQWIVNEQQHGKVWRRKIIVVEDWHEVPRATPRKAGRRPKTGDETP